VLVGWTGTYGTVDVLYNKTGIFTASYSSVTGLTGTTTTIRGLSSSTYYFRIRPYSDTGMRERTAAWRTSRRNSPSISKFQGYVWFVVYGVVVGGVHDGGRFVDIQRGRSGKRGADGAHWKHDHHNRAKQSGRLHLTITPSGYGTTGTSKSIVITKTNYTPIINNVYASSSGIESVMVEWVGNIRTCPLNTTSLEFYGAYTVSDQVVLYSHGLSISTTYYFRVVPYYSTTVGTVSSVASVSTDQPERGYKLMKHDKFNSTIPHHTGI
jgi:hypothetical protein